MSADGPAVQTGTGIVTKQTTGDWKNSRKTKGGSPYPQEGDRAPRADSLIGGSAALRLLEEDIRSAAWSDAPVLITGDRGTGKTHAARLIHQQSHRQDAPFASVDCRAIADSRRVSTLMDTLCRDSVRIAEREPGVTEVTHGGVLLLRDVGQLSVRLQGLLFHFLESGVLLLEAGVPSLPHGGSGAIHVNVRIIATGEQNLFELVAAHKFRDDLYYRLNAVHLTCPPLRHRREDILPLLAYFLQRCAEAHQVEPPQLSSEAVAQLLACQWPGNVQQLKAVVDQITVRLPGEIVSPEELPSEIVGGLRREPARRASLQ